MLLGFSRLTVAAQEELAAPVMATVTVKGHGAVSVTPDTATVTVGIDVIRPTLEEAQADATRHVTAIIGAVKELGVAKDDIRTAYYTVWVIRDYDDDGNILGIKGYEVSHQLSLTVRDIDTMSDVLGVAIAAGANNVYGVSFYLADPTAAASRARQVAMADARRIAEELAAAESMSVGRVLAIAEGVGVEPPIYFTGGGAGGGPPIESGTSQVTVDVQVSYELR
jgi:hypothetical protein